jgi:hypothetical protein
MANPQENSDLFPPITIDDLKDDSNYLIVPDTTLQLQADTINVLENRVSLSTFSSERQQQILDYYRYSADYQNRRGPQKPAKRTIDTLDLI